MNPICTLFGIWCAAAPVAHSPLTYNDQARIVFPVEAFGANWRVKNFRKAVLFPDNINNAFDRAKYAANDYRERTGLPVTITFAPRTYMLKRPLWFTDEDHDLTIRGLNINGTALASAYGWRF